MRKPAFVVVACTLLSPVIVASFVCYWLRGAWRLGQELANALDAHFMEDRDV